MKLFELHRTIDATGVSGTGIVAEGVEFTDGTVALRWKNVPATSTAIYNSIEDVDRIHGHGGATQIVWIEGTR